MSNNQMMYSSYIQWTPKIDLFTDEEITRSYMASNNIQYVERIFYDLPLKKEELPSYFVFIDLGQVYAYFNLRCDETAPTEEYCTSNKEYFLQRIPKICKFAALICKRDDFLTLSYDEIKFENAPAEMGSHSLHEDEYVKNFHRLNEMYENPLFISHNGFLRDFAILLANSHKLGLPIEHIRCADAKLLFNSKCPYELDNIYETVCLKDPSPKVNYLLDANRQSYSQRNEMTARFLHERRSSTPFNNYSIGLEFIDLGYMPNFDDETFLSRFANFALHKPIPETFESISPQPVKSDEVSDEV